MAYVEHGIFGWTPTEWVIESLKAWGTLDQERYVHNMPAEVIREAFLKRQPQPFASSDDTWDDIGGIDWQTVAEWFTFLCNDCGNVHPYLPNLTWPHCQRYGFAPPEDSRAAEAYARQTRKHTHRACGI